MRYTPHIILLILLIGAIGCTSTKKVKVKDVPFTTLESGIKYKLLKDVKGKQYPKEGDFVRIHISTFYEDSVIMESKVQSGGEPIRFPVSAPRYHGDLSEVFPLMTAGDSGIFFVPVDTMIALGQKLQPWMKAGGEIRYSIELVSVQTREEVTKEMEEKAKEKGDPEKEDKEIQEYLKKNKIDAEKRSSGLYYTITKSTDGMKPLSGKTVYVNYTGKLMNGTIFDSNVGKDPFKFILGRGQVILGWDEGIALLKKGEKATLIIPSHLAYGENPPTTKIPPNATLIFDVELVDF